MHRVSYRSPESVRDLREALSLSAKRAIIGGGQILIPQLLSRDATPVELLVDLRRVPEATTVSQALSGLLIGAALPLTDVAASPVVRREARLLAHVAGHVADQQTRATATLGGAVACADPASDLCAVLLALGASARFCTPEGIRTVALESVLGGQLHAAIGRDAAVTGVWVPRLPATAGWAYRALRARRSARSTVGVAVVQTGIRGSIAVSSLYTRPGYARDAERAMAAGESREDVSAKVKVRASPVADPDGDPEYRLAMAERLLFRALAAIAGHDDQGIPDHLSSTHPVSVKA
jgi:carbon-monoxide dehydrogenase medium subunit